MDQAAVRIATYAVYELCRQSWFRIVAFGSSVSSTLSAGRSNSLAGTELVRGFQPFAKGVYLVGGEGVQFYDGHPRENPLRFNLPIRSMQTAVSTGGTVGTRAMEQKRNGFVLKVSRG